MSDKREDRYFQHPSDNEYERADAEARFKGDLVEMLNDIRIELYGINLKMERAYKWEGGK